LSGFVQPVSSSLSLARLAVTLFALMAFTLQTYVVQVHVHGPGMGTEQKLDGAAKRGDAAHCVICQEILHFGHYVTPVAGGWSPVLVTVPFTIARLERIAPTALPWQGWNSRAPPSA
jgi:hypothetical protein